MKQNLGKLPEDSVKEACVAYAEKIWWEKDSDYFFLAPDRAMISPMTVYQRYRRYLEAAGISHGGKGQGPRLRDIRHTFAVHVLQKWIKEGEDLTAMLPILSTYMGHKTVRLTALYLRLTAEVYPELNTVTIILTGKGGKSRIVPVMKPTGELLKQYIEGAGLSSPIYSRNPLFTNRDNKLLTRAGVTYILKKYASQAQAAGVKDISGEITPH